MSKMITVCGAPGSGSTTTAVQLALRCAEQPTSSVLLVLCNRSFPAMGYLAPDAHPLSLGALLTQVGALTEQLVLQGTVAPQQNFGILGYNLTETAQAYPQPTRSGINRFCDVIQTMADTVIFDLGGEVEDDLAKVIFARSERVVTLLAANVKGIAWYKHTRSCLPAPFYVLCNLRRGQPTDLFDDVLILPHSDTLETSLEELKMFALIHDKKYRKALNVLYDRLLQPGGGNETQTSSL